MLFNFKKMDEVIVYIVYVIFIVLEFNKNVISIIRNINRVELNLNII